MTAAVETSNGSNKFAKSIRWRSKLLFSKGKQAGENVEIGAKGGESITEDDPLVEESDKIQNGAGNGLNVNGASTSAGNKHILQEDRLEKEKQQDQSSSRSSPSHQEGKRKENQTEEENISTSVDKIAFSRRGSLAPGNQTNIAIDQGSEEGESIKEVDRIVFYYKNQPYFWLSNSSDHPIYLDGVLYPTAEHLFQSLKFLPHKPEIANKIRKQSSASDATLEARKQSQNVRKGWISQGENVTAMRTVLLLKFSQHSNLRSKLLRTGAADLISDSPTDAFWGIASGGGKSVGAGRNELGKALMKTRETIRSQAGLGFGSAAKTV